MAAKRGLKERFDALEPDKKRKLVMTLAVTGFVGLITVAVLIQEARVPATQQQQEIDPNDVSNVLMTTESRELGLQGVANTVDDISARLSALEADNERLRREAEQARAAAGRGGRDSADETLDSLARDVDSRRGALPSPIGTLGNRDRPVVEDPMIDTTSGVVRPTQNNQFRGGASNNGRTDAPGAALLAPQIQTFRQAAPAEDSASAVRTTFPPVFIPTGSIFTGTMLNGLDAPTGRQASNQPIPVLVRVKHEAILPSRFRSDVREAFLLGAGFGDLSSERAYIRAERLSMILRDGSVIDIPLRAAAVGPDGKTGVRGRVVSKQGAVIGKALLSGMADGISRAFGGTQIGGSGGEDVDLAGAAFGGGASSGLDRIASYFLSQAEAMYPVIEIDGGRELSFILLEGVELTPRVPTAVVPTTGATAASTGEQRTNRS
ncbi:MAG: hypothetical protein DDT34_01468 [Firmicutes bacterium]|nr:hypothetical protein [Bacillota bacterium]